MTYTAYDEDDAIVAQGDVPHECDGSETTNFHIEIPFKRLYLTPPDPVPTWYGNDVAIFITINYYTACPTATGDSILDLPEMRQGLRELWELSNPDSAADRRIERMGYLVQDLVTGEYSFEHIPVDPSHDNPCRSRGFLPGMPGKRFVAHAHTHPMKHMDVFPPSCQAPAGMRYDAVVYGGPSGPDLQRAATEYQFSGDIRIERFYVIDEEFIYSVPPGTTTNNAQTNVKQYLRTSGSNCPSLP